MPALWNEAFSETHMSTTPSGWHSDGWLIKQALGWMAGASDTGTYVLVLVVQVLNLVYFPYSTYLSVIAASVIFDCERYNIRFRIHAYRFLATV